MFLYSKPFGSEKNAGNDNIFKIKKIRTKMDEFLGVVMKSHVIIRREEI